MIRNPNYDDRQLNENNDDDNDDDDEEDDIEWRRGRIKSIDAETNTADVHLIDEGFNWENQPIDKMITFEQLGIETWLPAQAKRCKLKSAYPACRVDGWTSDSNEYFTRLLNDNRVVVTSFNELEQVINDDHVYELEISIK